MFLANDHQKYSVGKNGGIEIYVAAEQPEGVPEESWLPVKRGDYDMNLIVLI